ncbi:MAG TPA: 50S ribosomal protein L4 [Gemmatirosa sp.]
MTETNDNTPTALQAASYAADGTARGERVTLPAELYDGTVNVPVMHQVVKAYLANQRQGTASTKTRGLVTGGNQKPWKQKGTGRARQGSIRAPQWPGGGTVFGPTPRDYTQRTNRKVKALARKSAFNARAREGDLLVVESLAMDAPSTKQFLALLGRLGVAEKKVLVLTNGVREATYLSARNTPNVHVMPYTDASTYHVLWSDVVLVEQAALTAPSKAAAEDAAALAELAAGARAATVDATSTEAEA